MKAMVLAAGEGTRLRPLTLETPKVLLPVDGVSLIERTLLWLKSHAITEVAINLHHLGEKIKSFLGDGSRFGLKVVYSEEERRLGTAGGVKRMEEFFIGKPQSLSPSPESPSSTFVVVYGDIVTDFNLSAMIEFHRQKKTMATMALFEAPNPKEVGIVEVNDEGRILTFTEKPQSPAPSPQSPSLASGGVYVLEKEILGFIQREHFCDFAYDIFPRVIKLGLSIYGYCLSHEDYLMDIGTPDNYHQVNEDIKAGKEKISHGK